MITFLILVVIIVFYISILIKLYCGLKKILIFEKKSKKISVSIILAAKNEEQAIQSCIEALLSQNYPHPLLEIIVIDDQSTDRTFDILNDYAQQHPNIIIIRLQKQKDPSSGQWEISSKKHALDIGIKQAKGEILLFTDADCIPPVTWVEEMITCFDKNVGVVAGFSPLIDNTGSILGKLIEFDSLVAATIAAAGIGLNKPITCTGRNFAYRKKVFEQVKGFTDIYHSVSGDDDLFLHLVKQKTDYEIKYNISQNAIIPSYQTKTIKQFLLQKRRHISAGKYYPKNLKLSYLMMHLANFCVYIFVLGAIIFNRYLQVAIVLFLAKTIADFLFVLMGAQKLKMNKLIKYFTLWELFFLVYNALVGPLAMIGKIKWNK